LDRLARSKEESAFRRRTSGCDRLGCASRNRPSRASRAWLSGGEALRGDAGGSRLSARQCLLTRITRGQALAPTHLGPERGWFDVSQALTIGDARIDIRSSGIGPDVNDLRGTKLSEIDTPRVVGVAAQRRFQPLCQRWILALAVDEQRVGNAEVRSLRRQHRESRRPSVEELIDHFGDEPLTQLLAEPVGDAVLSV